MLIVDMGDRAQEAWGSKWGNTLQGFQPIAT
jgi:hypothetical protein